MKIATTRILASAAALAGFSSAAFAHGGHASFPELVHGLFHAAPIGIGMVVAGLILTWIVKKR